MIDGDQAYPSVAMTPDGDYVVVWSGQGNGDNQGVYFKTYSEPTDTAGPIVTDFLLPDGTPITSGTQVSQPLYAVVLTFDEAMLDNATHTGSAVTNPANYQLLSNGLTSSEASARSITDSTSPTAARFAIRTQHSQARQVRGRA